MQQLNLGTSLKMRCTTMHQHIYKQQSSKLKLLWWARLSINCYLQGDIKKYQRQILWDNKILKLIRLLLSLEKIKTKRFSLKFKTKRKKMSYQHYSLVVQEIKICKDRPHRNLFINHKRLLEKKNYLAHIKN